MTPLILFDVPEVCAVQVVPSGEVRIVPELPTATNETLEVVSLESLFLAQEIIVRLKRDMRIMYKTLFILFPPPVMSGGVGHIIQNINLLSFII